MRDTYVSKLRNCEDKEQVDKLLECVLGLSSSDIRCYELILESQPTWTDELSNKLGKDESTIHRSVSRLSDSGLIIEEKIPYENGGYKHEYIGEDIDEVAQSMRLLTSEWAKSALNEVDRFEEEFEDNSGDH